MKPLHDVLQSLVNDRRQSESVFVVFVVVNASDKATAGRCQATHFDLVRSNLQPTLRAFDKVFECPPLGIGLVLQGADEAIAEGVKGRWQALLNTAGIACKVNAVPRLRSQTLQQWANRLLS
jgi:hypothetical protein